MKCYENFKSFFIIQFLLCSAIFISAHGANITISGPNLICPLQPATYTASATWIGPQKGCFEFQFYENGQWYFSEAIHCPCYGQTFSRSYTHTWQYTGNNKVRVRFFANYRPAASCIYIFKLCNTQYLFKLPNVCLTKPGSEFDVNRLCRCYFKSRTRS